MAELADESTVHLDLVEPAQSKFGANCLIGHIDQENSLLLILNHLEQQEGFILFPHPCNITGMNLFSYA